MNTILIILGILAIGAAVYFYFYKTGKINDRDGDYIPDEVEDTVDKGKAKVKKTVKTVKTRVAKTPTAAASDGVAIPEYIDPKTINIKIVIGTRLNNPKTMSFTDGFFSIVGAKEGLIRHLTIM